MTRAEYDLLNTCLNHMEDLLIDIALKCDGESIVIEHYGEDRLNRFHDCTFTELSRGVMPELPTLG